MKPPANQRPTPRRVTPSRMVVRAEAVTLERVLHDDAGACERLVRVNDASSRFFLALCDRGRLVETVCFTPSRRAPGADASDTERGGGLDAVRRAYDVRGRADDERGERSSSHGWTRRHASFHGASPAVDASSSIDGDVSIVAQRDGTVCAWRRAKTGDWAVLGEAAYAGAVAKAVEAFGKGDAWRGDVTRVVACTTDGGDSEGRIFAVTLSEDESEAGKTWLVVREVRVDVAASGDAKSTEVAVSARYDDAIDLVQGNTSDVFWVVTRSGVMYRWSVTKLRATARADVGMKIAERLGARDQSVDLVTCRSFPDGDLVCVDVKTRRVFAIKSTASGSITFDELSVLGADSFRAGERVVAAARHGAFLWIVAVFIATDSESTTTMAMIRVFHTTTGACVASAEVPSAPGLAEFSSTIELVNAGSSGMYVRMPASDGGKSAIFRCAISIPRSLANAIRPILDDPTAFDATLVDRSLSEIETYGASVEALVRALVLVRRELASEPGTFKVPREASTAMTQKHARASCALAPALLLKAQLTGRFDDVASARWAFAAKDCLEMMEKASASGDLGAFSRLASDSLTLARDALLDAQQTTAASDTKGKDSSSVETSDMSSMYATVRELESFRGRDAALPAGAWAGARALKDFQSDTMLERFIDAVWCDETMRFPTVCEDASKMARDIADAAASKLSRARAEESSGTSAMFAPFEAMTFLMYRIAPQCAVAFIDAVAIKTKLPRVELAKRALTTTESPKAHFARFGDSVAAEALTRAVVETLCAADFARTGLYVALTFAGVTEKRSRSEETASGRRGKTTAAGWTLAHDVLRAELDRRRTNSDASDIRRFAVEAFDVMGKLFRTLIEDWNEMPFVQSREDVDVDVAAELILRAADVVREVYEDADSIEEPFTSSSRILDLAHDYSMTMTEACIAAARGETPHANVDSLERLIRVASRTLVRDQATT